MRATLAAPLVLAALIFAASAAAAATAPPAQKTGGIVGLDVMTGTVFQEGQSSFSGIATRMRIRNAALVPNLELMPSIEYWQNTSHLDAFDIETRRRDATLAFDARWVFPLKAWKPYGGAGFSMHFLDDELLAPRYGTPHATNGVVKGGWDLLGGADFSIGGRLGSFVELKYLGVTRYRQVKFNTGLAWNL